MVTLRERLIELASILQKTNEIDWLPSLPQHVDYQSNEATKIVRADLEHLVGGLSIVYLFAIFENYYPIKYWEDFISDPVKLEVLRAYRHVRHSVAHGHKGKRVAPKSQRNIKEYEALDKAIKRNLLAFKSSIEKKKNGDLKISRTAGLSLRTFMMGIADHSMVKDETTRIEID
jgi:hypothetical protein